MKVNGLPLLWSLIAGIPAMASQAPVQDDLKALFRDPPHEYSIEPLWSWNGALEHDRLVWQIDQMVEQGVFGAYMHARDGLDQSRTPYFSDGFWEAVRTSVEHGEKAGFRTWIYDEDKWPSGDAGGRTRAADPERFTALSLARRFEDVRGPALVELDYPQARFLIAARKTARGGLDAATLRDLTGHSEWQVPEGEWRLSIFEPVRRTPPRPNYLNPDMVREFIGNTYEQYAARFSAHFGKTIPGSFFDEIDNAPLAWDPLLEERFRAARGYELRTVLPLLYEEGGARTIAVRCDYFEELTRLYADAWFRQLSEWCAQRGLELTGHTLEELSEIRSQGDYFRTWRLAQRPGTDNEDFRYTYPRTIGSWKPKQLSSLAHVYGKPRAMVEALGGAGWTVTLDQARYGVSLLAACGINDFVFHLFHYSLDTPEAQDDWPNSWFYQNPYWKYFRVLADYTRRLSFIGSRGAHVSDVAVLYPVEEVWSQGLEQRPPGQPPVARLVDRLMREHVDCDLVDTDSLARATLDGDRARIGAESYRVLVLPDVSTVSLRAYAHVEELADRGLIVLALGSTPRHSAEHGAEDPEVLRISTKLFPSGGQREEALVADLRARVVPDLEVEAGDGSALRHYHRRIGGRDFYLLANSERQAASLRVRFAAEGGAERWDPLTGATAALPLDAPGVLRLELEPWEAYFVVFGRDLPETVPTAPRPEQVAKLEGPWTLQLAPTELDRTWRPDPGETRVEVPVARFRIEREGEDRLWRPVKLSDSLSPKQGAARYLSAWDAAWITRYRYARHPGEVGGAALRFLTELEVSFVPTAGKLTLVADGAIECRWNGASIASGSGRIDLDTLPVVPGRNRLEIAVEGEGFLLGEGEVRGASGERLPIRTDGTWSVARLGGESIPAYVFAFPPLGKWGEPVGAGREARLPAVGAYRFALPPGALWLEMPDVRGAAEWSVDGRPLAVAGAGRRISLPAGARELALRVQLTEEADGLQGPIAFHCSKVPAELGDWSASGLAWYSGRAVYTTHFRHAGPSPGQTLTLDLGELCYTGEVWVNGRLAGVLTWPPYRVDVTRLVHRGENELSVVVANLLANRMRWNIFDAALSRPMSRWWHDGNILRDADKLRSGLIGPARLITR